MTTKLRGGDVVLFTRGAGVETRVEDVNAEGIVVSRPSGPSGGWCESDFILVRRPVQPGDVIAVPAGFWSTCGANVVVASVHKSSHLGLYLDTAGGFTLTRTDLAWWIERGSTHLDGTPIDLEGTFPKPIAPTGIRRTQAFEDRMRELSAIVAPTNHAPTPVKLARPARIGDRMFRRGRHVFTVEGYCQSKSVWGVLGPTETPHLGHAAGLTADLFTGPDAFVHEDGAPVDVEETGWIAWATEDGRTPIVDLNGKTRGRSALPKPLAPPPAIYKADWGPVTQAQIDALDVTIQNTPFLKPKVHPDNTITRSLTGLPLSMPIAGKPLGSSWDVDGLAWSLFHTDPEIRAYVRTRCDDSVLSGPAPKLQYEGRPRADHVAITVNLERFTQAMDRCWASDDKSFRSKCIARAEEIAVLLLGAK